jgi:hypothetical protein
MMREVRGNSVAGREVLAYVEERLTALRVQLEAPDCDERRSSQLRGRIAELKQLTSWVNDMGNEA